MVLDLHAAERLVRDGQTKAASSVLDSIDSDQPGATIRMRTQLKEEWQSLSSKLSESSGVSESERD